MPVAPDGTPLPYDEPQMAPETMDAPAGVPAPAMGNEGMTEADMFPSLNPGAAMAAILGQNAQDFAMMQQIQQMQLLAFLEQQKMATAEAAAAVLAAMGSGPETMDGPMGAPPPEMAGQEMTLGMGGAPTGGMPMGPPPDPMMGGMPPQ